MCAVSKKCFARSFLQSQICLWRSTISTSVLWRRRKTTRMKNSSILIFQFRRPDQINLTNINSPRLGGSYFPFETHLKYRRILLYESNCNFIILLTRPWSQEHFWYWTNAEWLPEIWRRLEWKISKRFDFWWKDRLWNLILSGNNWPSTVFSQFNSAENS